MARIKQPYEIYFTDFLSNEFIRDFRCFKDYTYNDICHALKYDNATRRKQYLKARAFLLSNYRHKKAKYHTLVGATCFYSTFEDYKSGNDNAKLYNHWFFDFDTHNAEFDSLKKQMKVIYKKLQDDEINLKEYFKEIDDVQKQIAELIMNNNLVNDAYLELIKVCEFFKQQGWKTYNCFSGSKGFHCRVFFETCHLNNYNQIISGLAKNLINKLNLKTLDEKVVFDNPSGRVERLPYTFNEKSGLRVTPFNIESGMDEVLSMAEQSSKQHPPKVDEFNMSEYMNYGLSSDLKIADKQLDGLVAKENSAKNKLVTERKLQGMATGKYYKNNDGNHSSLFTDLRKLVQFVCGSDYLVKEYELYDKYYCVFHEDNHPSAIVGSKYYQCHSSNCKIGSIGKINYFDFIKHYFKLKSDLEVKEKMVQLQSEYDAKTGNANTIKGGDIRVKPPTI